MRPAHALLSSLRPTCAAAGALLAGCLATPAAEPPVVSTSERRAQYRAEVTAVVVMAPPTEAAASRGQPSAAGATREQVDAALLRRLRAAGVPTIAATPPGTAAPRRPAASHFVQISLPAAAVGRTALQVELRDTLTRTVVWRYAGELDTRSGTPPQQVAERMADAVIHRLREDGLLAR